MTEDWETAAGTYGRNITTAPPRLVPLVSRDCDPMRWGKMRRAAQRRLTHSSASLAASLKIATNISRVNLPVCVF